ncbi:MAG: hypothetical protein ACI90U_001814 [Pseudomonadales bacterium]
MKNNNCLAEFNFQKGLVDGIYKLQYSDSSKNVWLTGDKLSVGSANSNGIAVSGSGVGEHHADVRVNGDKITLCPIAGCTTTVNGAKVNANRDLQVENIMSFANVGMKLILPVEQAIGEAVKSTPKAPDAKVNPE